VNYQLDAEGESACPVAELIEESSSDLMETGIAVLPTMVDHPSPMETGNDESLTDQQTLGNQAVELDMPLDQVRPLRARDRLRRPARFDD